MDVNALQEKMFLLKKVIYVKIVHLNEIMFQKRY